MNTTQLQNTITIENLKGEHIKLYFQNKLG